MPARPQVVRRATSTSAVEVGSAEPGQPAASDAAIAEVVAARRWAYDAPDDPLAHFHLATALDHTGHPVAARRAFRSALIALDNRAAGPLDDGFEGYDPAELRRLLVAKCRPLDDPAALPRRNPSR